MPKITNDGLRKRCGCGKRTWPKCAHPWHVNFHHGDREYRYSLDAVAKQRHEPAPRKKADALAWRDKLRGEIRAGEFHVHAAPPPTGGLTVGDVADAYLKGHVQREGRRTGGRKLMEWYVAALRRAEIPAAGGQTLRLEQKPIKDVTTADVLAIRDGWTRRKGSHGGRVGVDRALKRLRHVFNWAIEHGHVEHTPFRRHGVTVVHFSKDQARTRRLEPGEEKKLLDAAPDLLKALIIAALETGMRKGELLALRWQDVHAATDTILLPAAITKTNEARDVPMTARLKAVLELRKHAPDGTEHPSTAFVFGNAFGEQVKDIRDEWVATCTAAKVTGLHFHDLRREFASRLRETPGISDHHVRDWLGHADMATTSRYLATTRVGLQQARKVFELHRAGFAHDSHKSEDETTPPAAEAERKRQLTC